MIDTQSQLDSLYFRISAGITTHSDTILLQSIIAYYQSLSYPQPLLQPTPHVDHQATQGSETS